MRKRILTILDAAYDAEPDEGRWLERIATSAAPLLDDGSGVHAMVSEEVAARPFRDPLLVGGEPAWRACWREHWWDQMIAASPPETLRAMLRFGAVSHSSELFAAVAAQIESFAELLDRMEEAGYQHALAPERRAGAARKLFYPDSLNLVCADASGAGLVLVANRRRRASLAPAQRRLLTRLAGHLAAASRLRRSRGRADPAPEGVASAEDGCILHAEGAAASRDGLAALRAAVCSVLRARVGRVEDPLAHWRALHAGRWTLVERFESDGRRVLVARENRSHQLSLPGLSRREREVVGLLALGQSNKEIAYRLGVTTSTVTVHLRRAVSKTGAADVRELVRRAREALDRGGPHGP